MSKKCTEHKSERNTNFTGNPTHAPAAITPVTNAPQKATIAPPTIAPPTIAPRHLLDNCSANCPADTCSADICTADICSADNNRDFRFGQRQRGLLRSTSF